MNLLLLTNGVNQVSFMLLNYTVGLPPFDQKLKNISMKEIKLILNNPDSLCGTVIEFQKRVLHKYNPIQMLPQRIRTHWVPPDVGSDLV